MAASGTSTIAGSVGVKVLPILTGFGKTLSEGATTEGNKAGAQLGRAYGSAAAKAAGPSLQRLGADLGKARSAEADAAGKVRIAEAALNDVRSRSNSTTAQVVRAEESLAKAQRGHETAQEKLKTSTATYSDAKLRAKQNTDQLAAAEVDATRKAGLLSKSLGGIDKATAGMASRAVSHLKGIAVAAAGVFATTKVVDFARDSVSTFQSTAMEVNKLKRLTGAASAEEASKLRFAFQQTGLDADKAGGAIGKLSKSLQAQATAQAAAVAKLREKTAAEQAEIASLEKTGELTDGQKNRLDKLKTSLAQHTAALSAAGSGVSAYGVQITDANGKMLPLSQTLPKIADQFKAMPDGMEKNAMAMKLFGKTGTDLIPFLNKGAKGLEELGIKADKTGNVVNDKMLKSVLAQKQAEKDWNASINGLKIQLGAALLPAMTSSTNWIRENMIPAIQGAAGFMREHSETIKAGVTWIKEHRTQLALAVGAFAALRLGIIATTTAMKIQAAGGLITFITFIRSAVMSTQAFTAAQWLLNAAQSANPLALIVIGLAALAAGLVIAYQRSETFRNIVTAAWNGIKAAALGTVSWFTGTAWPAIRGFFSGMGSAAAGLKDGVVRAWGAMRTGTENVWNAIRAYFVAVWAGYTRVFRGASDGIKLVVSAAWTWIRDTSSRIWGGITNAIGATWTSIRNKISAGVDLAKRVVSNGWSNIRTNTTTAWNGIRDFFPTLFTQIGEKFKAGVDKIAGFWDGLRDKLKAPIRAVIEKINDPMVSGFNRVSGIVHGPTIPTIPLTGLYAGGVVPGPVAPPGVDNTWGMIRGRTPIGLAGGEMVLNNTATASVDRAAPGFLDDLNTRGAAALGLAAGGRVWPTTSRRLSPNYGGHSGIDIPVPIGTPVFAAGDGTVQYVGTGKGYGIAVFQSLPGGLSAVYGHNSRPLVSPGQSVKAGQQISLSGNTGRSTGPHLHFEVNSSGRFASPSNRSGTLSWLGGAQLQGSGQDVGSGAGFNPLAWIAEKALDGVKGIVDRALSALPDSPAFMAITKGTAKTTVDSGLSWLKSLIGATPSSTDGDASAGTAGGASRWSSLAAQALAREGLPSSLLPMMLHRINVESGGNPSAINNWDSNARRGTPSRGLMQVIGPTFAAYRDRSLPNDINDPLANMVAAIRYTRSRYGGDFRRAWGGTSGYAEGGRILDSMPRKSIPSMLWDIRPGTTQTLPPGPSIAWNLTGRDETLMRVSGGTGAGLGGVHINKFESHNSNAAEVLEQLEFKIRSGQNNRIYRPSTPGR